MDVDRRSFIAAVSGAAVGAAVPTETQAAAREELSLVNEGVTGPSNAYTRRMAEFVSNLKYEAIPAEVIERIKLLILDSFGCAIFGAELPWSRILIDTLRNMDATQHCRLWGSAAKLSAPHAALVNGTLVQSFELDDVHPIGILHVGAVALPGVLAISELHQGIDGRGFLTACVAGYETGPRVGMCMGPEHIEQGWHSGATVGVFSAVSGAASALRLSAGKTVHALGIAGTQASGLMAAQFGAMVKRMHAGRAAQSGLYGAILAQNGFTGIVDVFENPYGGFCTTFSRSKDRFKLKELTDGLGERFETMRISLKFYSCVASNHTTLDAIRMMRSKRPFGPDEVERIIVRGSRVTVEHVGWKYVPQGLTAAQLNLPYCVATLLIEGDVFVDQFSEDKVAVPERMTLAQRVEVIEDPAITAKGAAFRHMVEVTVILKDGTHMEQTLEAARGSERSFASEADVIEKFRKLAGRRIPSAKADEIIDLVLNIERLGDVRRLATLLAST